MKILELRAENFKRLKAVEIHADGANTVVIAGKNAQGKSSVLDAIWAALAGKKGAVEEPIRKGANEASVRLVLDQLVVTRRWKNGGNSTLTVESKAGARFPTPQAVLDKMLGEFSFDPLAFAHAKPRDQRDTLLGLIGVDLDALEAERKGYFDQRTVVNREVKRLQGVLSSLDGVRPDTPREEVDVSQLAREASALQADIAELARLRRRHAELTQELESVVRAGQIVSARLPENAEATLERTQNCIESASGANRLAAIARDYDRTSAQLTQSQADADQLTDAIAEVEQRKVDAIATAGLPVAGLGFDEDGVTLNGVTFAQASAAERLRTSVAIALAANPEIRVIRITDGSLLDSDNLRIIEEMAAERDAQIWIEKVDESGNVGIVIEDGSVKQ